MADRDLSKHLEGKKFPQDMQEPFHYRPCLSDIMACYRHKASLLAMIPETENRVSVVWEL